MHCACAHRGPRFVPSHWIATACLIGGTACAADDSGATPLRVASSMELVSGDGQVAPYGSTLPLPLVVLVKDQYGSALGGTVVSFTANNGASVDHDTRTTDGSGQAQVLLSYSQVSGMDTVFASAAGVATPVYFVETVNSGPPALMTVVSGNNQSATAGTHLANPLVVRVTDPAGNRIKGLPIVWFSATGAPGLTTTSSGADGTAQLVFSPATGANTVGVSVDRTSITATFTATGN